MIEKTSANLQAMIRRKQLVRMGGDEAELRAEEILEQVLQAGGLTTAEVYALMVH